MIKELHLHNWKSFEESVLYIDPLTMLIGTNASGKSNVVDALVFLQKICSGASIQDALKGIRGGTEWPILYGKSTTKLTVILGGYNPNDEDITYSIEISKSVSNTFEVHSESLFLGQKRIFKSNEVGKNDPSISVLLYNEKEVKSQVIDFRRSHSILHLSYQIASKLEIVKETIVEAVRTFTNMQLLDPVPANMRQLVVPFSAKLNSDASNFAGVLAFHSLDNIKPIILDYLKEFPENEIFDLQLEKIGPNASDAMLLCSEKWADGDSLTVDSRVLSDGTLRFLGIMTAVLTSDPNSLLVIEEIDNGFHPSRARLLIDFLKKYGSERNIDILCTTHNPAFLDSLGIEMLPFISVVYRDAKSGNSKISLLEDVKTLPKMLAKGSIGDMTTQGLLTDYFENEYVGS